MTVEFYYLAFVETDVATCHYRLLRVCEYATYPHLLAAVRLATIAPAADVPALLDCYGGLVYTPDADFANSWWLSAANRHGAAGLGRSILVCPGPGRTDVREAAVPYFRQWYIGRRNSIQIVGKSFLGLDPFRLYNDGRDYFDLMETLAAAAAL